MHLPKAFYTLIFLTGGLSSISEIILIFYGKFPLALKKRIEKMPSLRKRFRRIKKKRIIFPIKADRCASSQEKCAMKPKSLRKAWLISEKRIRRFARFGFLPSRSSLVRLCGFLHSRL